MALRPEARIITIRPSNGGNRVWVVAFAYSKQGATWRARFESSDVILIRDQRVVFNRRIRAEDFLDIPPGEDFTSSDIVGADRILQTGLGEVRIPESVFIEIMRAEVEDVVGRERVSRIMRLISGTDPRSVFLIAIDEE